MLSLMLLACKSEQDLQTSNQNPGVTQSCDCTEEAETLSTLREELDVLSDRVIELEAIVTEGTTEPSVVVTEYEVDCGAPTKMFDLLAYDGLYYPMNYIEDWSELSNSTFPQYCILAKVDPLDPPWAIHQVAVHDARRGLGGGGDNDPFALYGNPWYYVHQGLSGPIRVHEDGYVLYDPHIEWDCSSGVLDADGDCPVEVPLVRVVIIDDKPALRPEAW